MLRRPARKTDKPKTDEMSELREHSVRWIREGAFGQARAGLHELLWTEGLSNATAAFRVARYERLRPHLPLVTYRVAILRSFTVEPLVPMLRAAAFANGIDLTVHVGGFNTYAQEILNPASDLY